MTRPIFQTERILCRRWDAGDFDSLLAVYSDADAMRWVGDGSPISRAECEEWFRVTKANYERRGYGMFTLESRASGGIVGFCGLVHPGGQDEPEVKYAIARTHWGQGLASEAIPALLAYGHEQHGLERIIATVAPENLASQRVLAKSGMRLAHVRENADGTSTYVFEWRGR